eukprot:UN22110
MVVRKSNNFTSLNSKSHNFTLNGREKTQKTNVSSASKKSSSTYLSVKLTFFKKVTPMVFKLF